MLCRLTKAIARGQEGWHINIMKTNLNGHMMTPSLEQALINYKRAQQVMIDAVASEFPPGCRVRCTKSGNIYLVKGMDGADRLHTNIGVVEIFTLIRMDQ